MATLPSATTRLSTQAGNAPISTDLIAVWAPCVSNADGVPRLYADASELVTAHGYCEGAEYAALHVQDTKKAVLFVPMPIATAGVVKWSKSTHTGTSKVTVAVGSDGALAEVDALIDVVRGGTIGTDQILLSMSLDNGYSYQTVRLGTASSYAVPNIGVTVSFGAGTLVAADTAIEFKTTGPVADSAGLTLGAAGMLAQQRTVRSWLLVGDCSTLAHVTNFLDEINAYETTGERYVYGKAQMRDRKVIANSQLRAAMVGSIAITFAEVGATGDTITRGTGSFVTDGFQVGDYIRVTGSSSNNVSGKIAGVTATVLTLDTTDLANEGPTTAGNVHITGEPSLVFAATTITRNRGSWVTEGFEIGDVITIDGGANDGVTATITNVSATVITCSAASFSVATEGSCSTIVSVEESDATWRASIEALVASVDGEKRIDLGAGRLTRQSPINAFTPRRPVQWADSIRSYQRDLKTPTWWKDLGPLSGWGIGDEHDERVSGGLLSGKFTCARTWGNGPQGAFIAMSLTRETDSSILGYTHNVAVASLAQAVCQRATESFVGATLVLKAADADGHRFATASSLKDLEAKVNRELQTNLLSNVGGEGQRASAARWTAATDDDLGVADATLHGTLALELNGTIVHISTTVKVS